MVSEAIILAALIWLLVRSSALDVRPAVGIEDDEDDEAAAAAEDLDEDDEEEKKLEKTE